VHPGVKQVMVASSMTLQVINYKLSSAHSEDTTPEMIMPSIRKEADCDAEMFTPKRTARLIIDGSECALDTTSPVQ
jgi:hypothetical protein